MPPLRIYRQTEATCLQNINRGIDYKEKVRSHPMKISSMLEISSDLLLNPLALVTLFLSLFLLYKWSFPALFHRKNLPPSPPKLPIIGNLHQIGDYPHRTFQTLSRKYGELMLVHLGSKPTLVISSKEMAVQTLKTHDSSFIGRPMLALTRHLAYNGKDLLFTNFGERWKSLRSICVFQLLSKKRVSLFRGMRGDEVALLVEKIRESPESVVNLSEMLFSLCNHLVCRATFGNTCEGDENSREFDKLIASAVEMLESNNIEDVLPWMGWINRFNGVKAQLDKLAKRFDDTLERIVQDHVDRVKDETSMKDFVDILLEAQGDITNTVPLDRETIKGVVFDMFAAGTHTMYVTFEWTFTEIMRHPRVMKRVQEEVRSVVGAKKAVAEEDLEKMVYLKAVIKEGLRFHIPVPLPVPRECLEDVQINGYDIPAGTQVLFNVWAIARDPAYWEDPEEFSPERFLDSPIDFKGQHFELLPFGAGRRGCPGMFFANAAFELALANLVYWFDWSLPGGAENESIDNSESKGTFPHKNTPLVVVATPWIDG